MSNLFAIPESLPGPGEFSETLLQEGGLVVEKIISNGHVTAAGDWYDQERTTSGSCCSKGMRP